MQYTLTGHFIKYTLLVPSSNHAYWCLYELVPVQTCNPSSWTLGDVCAEFWGVWSHHDASGDFDWRSSSWVSWNDCCSFCQNTIEDNEVKRGLIWAAISCVDLSLQNDLLGHQKIKLFVAHGEEKIKRLYTTALQSWAFHLILTKLTNYVDLK